MPRCKFTKSNGLKCKQNAKAGFDFCSIHCRCTEIIDEEQEQEHEQDMMLLPMPPSSQHTHPVPMHIEKPNNNKPCDNDDVDDNISICTNTSIQSLKNDVDDLRDVISKLTNAVSRIQITSHKSRAKKDDNLSQARILQKAKLLYYQDHKRDIDIHAHLKQALETANLTGPFAPKNTPWQFVFGCTSHKFAEADDNEKNHYMMRAQQLLIKTNKTN